MHAPYLMTNPRRPVCASVPRSETVARQKMRPSLWFSLVVFGLDSLAFSSIYLFSLRARLGLDSFSLDNIVLDIFPLFICFAAVLITFITIRSYHTRTDMLSSRFAAEHVIACLMAFFLSLFFQFSIFLFDFSRSRLALLVTFIAFAPLALLYRRWLYADFVKKIGQRCLLIIGAGHRAAELYQHHLREGAGYRLRFIDFSGLHAGHPVDGIGSPEVEAVTEENFLKLIDHTLEAVVLADEVHQLSPQAIEILIRTHFQRAPILTLEGFYEQYWAKIPVATSYPYPHWALQQDFCLARDSSYRLFKRVFDLLGAALLLFLALVPMALCALALILEGSGPVFYRQERAGRDGSTFTLYKFRTMRTSPVTRTEELYSQDHDQRITPVGFWLRRLRLDELPQLINVLKGNMSLIGPRAEWVRCVEIYEQEIPCYHFRHLVKPGITGWAQVNYPYGRSVQDTVNKLQYDLYYIKNYSFLLDATIILKTLYVVLSFKG